MASLTKSDVAVIDDWYSGGLNARKFHYKKLSITLTSMGSVANAIPAEVLGLRKIQGCEPLVKTDDTLIVLAAPSTDRSQLLLKAAGTNAPGDYSGVFHVIVHGIA